MKDVLNSPSIAQISGRDVCSEGRLLHCSQVCMLRSEPQSSGILMRKSQSQLQIEI